jgi:hypothetical protein
MTGLDGLNLGEKNSGKTNAADVGHRARIVQKAASREPRCIRYNEIAVAVRRGRLADGLIPWWECLHDLHIFIPAFDDCGRSGGFCADD